MLTMLLIKLQTLQIFVTFPISAMFPVPGFCPGFLIAFSFYPSSVSPICDSPPSFFVFHNPDTFEEYWQVTYPWIWIYWMFCHKILKIRIWEAEHHRGFLCQGILVNVSIVSEISFDHLI